MKYYQVLKDLVDLQDKYELDAYNYTEINDKLVLIAEEAILVDELLKCISTLEKKLDTLKKEKLKAPYKLKQVVDKDNYKEYFWNDQQYTYKVIVTDTIEVFNQVCIWEEQYRNINYYDIKEIVNKEVVEALINSINDLLTFYQSDEDMARYHRNIEELKTLINNN